MLSNQRKRTALIAGAMATTIGLSACGPAAYAEPPYWGPPGHAKERHYKPRPIYDDRYDYRPAPTSYRSTSAGSGSGLVGSLLGAAVGAAVGNNFGGGNGRIAAVAGGAVIGAIVGGNIGRSMQRADYVRVNSALETAPTGRTTTWQNPDSGVTYNVTPTRTYQTTDNRYCREYTTTGIIGGRQEQLYGTACRQPDGSWEKVN